MKEEELMPGLLARLRARIPLEEGSLVLITMIWGATFIIIRSALEATGPFFFVGVRFAFAALALVLFSLPLLRDFTWREVWAGMSIGLCIFGGSSRPSMCRWCPCCNGWS